MSFPFNVRVYGVLIHHNHILLSDEVHSGRSFTKMPGGGLEFGEGLRDALKREFLEETGLDVRIGDHIYTTDFFQVSAFNPKDQVISIYYKVHLITIPESLEDICPVEENQCFRWIHLDELSAEDFTFPIDKHVSGLIAGLR